MPLSTIDNTGLSQSQILSAINMPTGSVIQVVQSTTNVFTSSSSGSYVSVGASFSISITPQFSTSKILVMFTGGNIDVNGTGSQPSLTIYRNGTTNLSPTGSTYNFNDFYIGSGRIIVPMNVVVLDSPATTSSTSYGLYWLNQGSANMAVNNSNSQTTMTLMEIR